MLSLSLAMKYVLSKYLKCCRTVYESLPRICMRVCITSGLYSSIMRDLANMTTDSPKWIVMDGDVDPMWIESLNTVMDDNKARH